MRGLSLFELIIALTIISLFAATLIICINKAAILARETALWVELKSLRLALVLYRAVNDSYPANLRVFIKARYKPKGSDEVIFGEKFLNTVGRDKYGYPIDPFGNKFKYNSRNGIVGSRTKGYENW